MSKMGRPSKYSKELAERICKVVSANPKSLVELCNENTDFPCKDTIQDWRINNSEFREMYLSAKMNQIETLVDYGLYVSRDKSGDVLRDNDDKIIINSANVSRSKTEIDYIKWLAARLLPRLYGDKIQTETKVTLSHEEALKEIE